jgi:hypothetical protein
VVSNAGHEQVLLQNEEAFPVILDFLAGKDVSDRRIGYPPLRSYPEGSDQVRILRRALTSGAQAVPRSGSPAARRCSR